MCCLLNRRGPLLSKIYSSAGYLRILTQPPLSFFISKQPDLKSHSDPLPSSPLFIHPAPSSTPSNLPSQPVLCPAEQGAASFYSSHTNAQFPCYNVNSCPMFFLLPSRGSCYSSWTLLLLVSFSLLPSVEPPTLREDSSNVAARDARAVAQPGLQRMLVIGVQESLLKQVHGQIFSIDLLKPINLGLRTV